MGEVLHIVSNFVFSYHLEHTFLVLLNIRGQDLFPTDMATIRLRQSSIEVVSIHNAHDISLSSPLSRVWGKSCTFAFS
jgi:hypothetical protein